MNEDRIPKVLNIKVIGKCPTQELKSGWELQIRKAVIQREGRPKEEI
jgi:hypothetical protein